MSPVSGYGVSLGIGRQWCSALPLSHGSLLLACLQGILQLAVLQRGFVALSASGPVVLTSLSVSYRLHLESHHSLMGQVKANELHCCAIDLVVRLKVWYKGKNHFIGLLLSLELNKNEC